MTQTEERKLFDMITAIYHHLGLDGKPLSFNINEQAKKDILKWKSKRLKKGHERETPAR